MAKTWKLFAHTSVRQARNGELLPLATTAKRALLFVGCAEIFAKFWVCHQVIQKCTADIGKPNARGIDVEAWLPGQDKYRETHTADYRQIISRAGNRVRRSDGSCILMTLLRLR